MRGVGSLKRSCRRSEAWLRRAAAVAMSVTSAWCSCCPAAAARRSAGVPGRRTWYTLPASRSNLPGADVHEPRRRIITTRTRIASRARHAHDQATRTSTRPTPGFHGRRPVHVHHHRSASTARPTPRRSTILVDTAPTCSAGTATVAGEHVRSSLPDFAVHATSTTIALDIFVGDPRHGTVVVSPDGQSSTPRRPATSDRTRFTFFAEDDVRPRVGGRDVERSPSPRRPRRRPPPVRRSTPTPPAAEGPDRAHGRRSRTPARSRRSRSR